MARRRLVILWPVVDDYFDETMVNRERLVWVIATRRQLERWEPIVARIHRGLFANRQPENVDIWAAQIEHHLALVAGRNLIRALDLPPASSVSVDSILRDELIEGRDLHEHWIENLPVFMVTPRAAQPKFPSGTRFAARNPKDGPYDWFDWGNKTGARLLPHVTAPALHELLDAVEAEVLAKNASLSRFVPPRAPSPWVRENGEWWPGPEHASDSGVSLA